MSMPALSDPAPPTATPRKAVTANHDILDDANLDHTGGGNSSSIQKHSEPPKAIRSRSFASAADPLISMDHANVASQKSESTRTQHPDATSAMKAISHKSRPTSPVDSPAGSSLPNTPSLVDSSFNIRHKRDRQRSMTDSPAPLSSPPTPTSTQSIKSISQNSCEGIPPDRNSIKSATKHEKKQSIGALSAATAATAKSWGWSVLNRTKEHRQQHYPDVVGTPKGPIGRGRPLPPPGQPLPLPEKPSTKVVPNGLTKRKPVPSPIPTPRRQSEASLRSDKAHPLPSRRRQMSTSDELDGQESLLVVAMPDDASPQVDDEKTPFTDHETADDAKSDIPKDPEAEDRHSARASTASTESSDVPSSNKDAKENWVDAEKFDRLG